jgi:hypothetical protein
MGIDEARAMQPGSRTKAELLEKLAVMVFAHDNYVDGASCVERAKVFVEALGKAQAELGE